MRFNYSFIILIFFCSISKTIIAQNFKEDVKKVQEAYKLMDKYHGEVITTSFKNEGSEFVDTRKMMVKKAGKNFLYEMDGMKMIFNERFTLTTNPKAKLIAFQKNAEGAQDKINLLPDINELLEKIPDVVYKGEVKGDKVYLVKNPDAMISQMEIFIDKKTFLFSKLVYHYNDQIGYEFTRSEIQMRHLNVNPTFSKNLFSEKKYVTIKNDQVKLNSRYQKFELILGQGLAYWQNE